MQSFGVVPLLQQCSYHAPRPSADRQHAKLHENQLDFYCCGRCDESSSPEHCQRRALRLDNAPVSFDSPLPPPLAPPFSLLPRHHNNDNNCRCGSAKEWKRATEIFDEARYVRRIRPSLQIYGALLGALADAERWADVLAYLDRMLADGVVPDATATNTAVLAAAELGDGRRALSLLQGEFCGRGGGGKDGGDGGELQRRQRQREVVRDGDVDGCSDDMVPRNRRPGQRESVPRVGGDGEEASSLEREDSSSVAVERRKPKEQGGGALLVGAVPAGRAVSPGGGVAAAVKVSTTAETPPGAAEEPQQGGARSADGAGAGRAGSGEDGDLSGGVARGGWETATPGLLNSVLHALDEAGEHAAVLEAVRRGREEGVLLNLNIYR